MIERLDPKTLPDDNVLFTELLPLIALSFTVVLLKLLLAAYTGIANIMQAKKHAKIETSDFFVTFFISKPPRKE